MPKYDWPDGVTEERQWAVATIIWTIFDNSPIESEAGRATGILSGLLHDEGIDMSAPWLSKTLSDLEDGGQFGHFIDRELIGKRTYSIAIARDPRRDPFPPDPREVAGGVVQPKAPDPDPEPEDQDEPELPLGIAHHADHIDDEIGTIDVGHLVETPGTAIEPVGAPSRADRILYMISMLNELLTEEMTAPQLELEARLDARLTAVNAVIEENNRLKKEVEDLKDKNRTLASALTQSNEIMRSRAAQLSTNGTHETVPA